MLIQLPSSYSSQWRRGRQTGMGWVGLGTLHSPECLGGGLQTSGEVAASNLGVLSQLQTF